MNDPLTASWLPPDLPPVDGQWRTLPFGQVDAPTPIRAFYPSAEGLRALADHLRRAQTRLRQLPTEARVQALDEVAARWLAPADAPHDALVAAIARITGFSLPMVEHALFLEQVSSRGPHLRRALVQELGAVDALDGWRPNPHLGGRSLAVGPGLVGLVCSANIPGLSHLDVMRALLVGGACLARFPSGEPLYLAAYAQSLWEICPALGAAVAVVGIERDDDGACRALTQAVDHLVVYGGTVAVRRWQALATPGPEWRPRGATWHGHHLGVSLICREALVEEDLPRLAEAVAYDFSLYDREACLSPAAVYVEEGGPLPARALAEALPAAMASWASRLPPRRLMPAEAAARRAWVDLMGIRGAWMRRAGDLGWVVSLDREVGFEPTGPGRLVRVVPVADLSVALDVLRPRPSLLQNASIAGPDSRTAALGAALAALGLSRLTRPGVMGTPSMMWRHDGGSCLASMVRWCDDEADAPEHRP